VNFLPKYAALPAAVRQIKNSMKKFFLQGKTETIYRLKAGNYDVKSTYFKHFEDFRRSEADRVDSCAEDSSVDEEWDIV
jgi:hypothetical protein